MSSPSTTLRTVVHDFAQGVMLYNRESMADFKQLKNWFKKTGYHLIIAADAMPRNFALRGKAVSQIPAGGVAVILDSIAQATSATYIGRSRVHNQSADFTVKTTKGRYHLKSIALTPAEEAGHYNGFANQTLWPLCHVAFEEPRFVTKWYETYKKVNQKYAKAIKASLKPGQKNFIWVNDYQLALVPHYLGTLPENTTLAMFWHIPWPTWEIFRILPYKEKILNSMLKCNFLGFHRSYHVQNFIQSVARELQTRINYDTRTVYLNLHATVVRNLPLGVDVDMIRSGRRKARVFKDYFKRYQVIFSVDRLDYTKGIKYRLQALDHFFTHYPGYRGKAVYLGLIAPSRESIPAYHRLKNQIMDQAAKINLKHQTKTWQPIHLVYDLFDRAELMNFYYQARACLVTPRDDGMNLVSKEFVVAAAQSKNPGMLVLSQFAGSAIDLKAAIIINPYDVKAITEAIKTALEMDKEEKIKRLTKMAQVLSEKNVYQWATDFLKEAIDAEA